MRIALVHDSFGICGGAERVALNIAKALKENGYKIDLFTVEKTSWDVVTTILGENYGKYVDNEFVMPPFCKLPTIYGPYLEWFARDILGFTLKLRKRYDLIINTKQLHVPIIADIAYMHFPIFYPGLETIYFPERYVHDIKLRAYSLPSHLLSRSLIKLFRSMKFKPLILTNSKFSKSMIRRWLGVNAVVVFPPVSNVEKLSTQAKNIEREDTIVTIGNLSNVKNQHIIPMIAKMTKNLRYLIVGTVSKPEYYRRLKRLVQMYGVEDRVKVIPNVDEDTKFRLLLRSKVYLHLMKYEHFGISVVEAMAAGLIPIVHRFSGSWIDIVNGMRESLGYAYLDHEECANLIEKAISLWSPDIALNLSTSALRFTYDSFKSKLYRVFNHYLES